MTSLAEHAKVLRDRVAKEIARGEAGTTALGGLTKAGNALEKLLKEAARGCCSAAGTSLERELRTRGVPPSLGAYRRIVAESARVALSDPVDRKLLRVLADDCAARDSAIVAMQQRVRNPAVHPDGDPFRSSGEVLRSLLRMLDRANIK